MKTLILTIHDIIKIVKHSSLNSIMDEMIDRLYDGLCKYDDEALVIPARHGFAYETPNTGLLEWMPILKRGEKATFKMVGYHPTNPTHRKLPTIISNLSTYDTSNGHLLAVTDATFLTAVRTGAASAVASRIAGHPDSKTVGIIGCGAQAVTQLHALSRVFDIGNVLIYDIDPVYSQSFLRRAAFIGLDVSISPLQDLVAQSDIISSATSVAKGEGPVFQDSTVKPWLHINAVGSDFPGKIELPKSLLRRSFVFPDFLEQAVVEGECQQLEEDEIGPSLAHIVKHQHQYGNLKDQISVFDSTGWALEDQIAMELLIERAELLGLGTRVQLETRSDDPKNPYAFLDSSKPTSKTKGDDDILKQLLLN